MGFDEIKKLFYGLPLESKLELIGNLPPDEKIAIGQRSPFLTGKALR